MKNYEHLRDDHSHEAARLVTFQVSTLVVLGKIAVFPGLEES